MLPRISIVTPSLNQGRYIGSTIESIARQRYSPLEYFVIDGGSSDETLEIVQRNAGIVTDCVSEPDSGQADAINKGFAKARGDILCWLNADDLLEPGTLATVAELYQRERFAFLYGDGWKFFERTGLRRAVRVGRVDVARLPVRDPILQPSTFWTRAVWDAVEGVDPRLHYVFDWDFFVKVARRFPLTYLRRPLSTYRIHRGHKSSSGGRKRAAEIMEVVHRHAGPEWRGTFDALWARYDDLEARRKVVRLLRTAMMVAQSPGLVARHGASRLGLAALTLL